jgi:hypothetical protein
MLCLTSLLTFGLWPSRSFSTRMSNFPSKLQRHTRFLSVFNFVGRCSYREGEWSFVRGALCTIDRNFGAFLNVAFHHISDTHVVHHLFSNLPHYHAEEATKHIKQVLGPYYRYSDQNVFKSLWRSSRDCLYVENSGPILFYKHWFILLGILDFLFCICIYQDNKRHLFDAQRSFSIK